MISRWFDKKQRALKLRRAGYSIRDVEKELYIPRSTLSGWFKAIVLTPQNQRKLQERRKNALLQARAKAVLWHNQRKAERLEDAKNAAEKTLDQLDLKNPAVTELALAMLYLGEGTKAKLETGIGSSDPKILRFFVNVLLNIYDVPRDKIRCELHLRADQNSEDLKSFWSEQLGIPRSNFGKSSFDARTRESPTFAYYKGVCAVRCSRVAIQRKLMYIATKFCDYYAEQKGG
ncbi:MAG: hypothetical protein AAB923_00155 [Patescibacteria group bacterium]